MGEYKRESLRRREAGLETAGIDEFGRLVELRISLFAQELGTSEPVSVQRLDRKWKEIS